jgi:plasmid stability protein
METAMGTLTIRELDDSIVERLKARAKANNRPLEGEVRMLLTEIAEGRSSVARLRDIAGQIAAMTPAGVDQTDSTELIRRDRDTR